MSNYRRGPSKGRGKGLIVFVLLALSVAEGDAESLKEGEKETSHPPVKEEQLVGQDLDLNRSPSKKERERFREQHPVLPHYPYDEGKAIAAANQLLQLGSRIKEMIPSQTAKIHCICAECGKQDAWRLDVDRLEKLLCGNCKTRYPNVAYPENHHATYRSYFGKPVSIPYHKKNDGTLTCFQGKLDELKFQYLVDTCESALGQAYQLTGDERYAKLACFILSCLAENAAGFLGEEKGRYATLYPWPRDCNVVVETALFPETFSPEARGTKFNCSVFPGQQKAYRSFIDLYDLTYSSSIYDTQKVRGKGGRSEVAREVIDRDFFGRVAAYLEAATECFGDEPHEFSNTGNLCSQYLVPAKIARVSGRWEDTRFDYHQQLRLTQDRWRRNYDAMSAEGPGYHLVWLGNHLQATYHMMHMEQPPGASEMRRIFDQGRAFEELARSRARMMMPNKTVPNLEDMGKREVPSAEFIAESISNILPGYGHAALGAGSEPMQQIQAHLQFSRFDNHAHRDSLHLNLFAKGREMYSDIGTCYTDGSLYSWAYDTLSHNTVVVDQKGQKDFKMDEKGNLEVYAPNLPGLSIVRVAMDAEGLDRYRRSVILNSSDLDHSYVVDIFEVHGGRMHDYSLHGSSDPELKQDLKVSLPMKKMQGEHPLLNVNFQKIGAFNKSYDTRMLYHFLQDVSISREGAEGLAAADFVYQDNPQLKTRALFKMDAEMQALTATSPSVEGRKFHSTVKDDPIRRFMPHLLLRRTAEEGDDALRSLYVVIHEPIDGETAIEDFQWLELDGAVGITVRMKGGREDYYLVALEESILRSYGALQGDGVLSAAITAGGKSDVYTVGGTMASYDGKEVFQEAPELIGSVLDYQSRRFGAAFNAIITDAELPLGTVMAGEVLVLEMTGAENGADFRNGYEIVDVRWADEAAGTRFVELRDDPYLRVEKDSVSEWYYPFRKAKRCRVVWQPSSCTVPRLIMIPNSGRYSIHQPNALCMFDQKQSMAFRSTHADARITLMADGGPVVEGAGSVAVEVDKNMMLTASVCNSDGVCAPPVLEQALLSRIPAERKNASGLSPGLELHIRNQNMGAVVGFDISQIKRHTPAELKGFVEVPRSGMYTIYSYAFPDVQLWIGEVPIITTKDDYTFTGFNGSMVNWFPVRARVVLEAGIHPLRLEYYNQGGIPGSIDIDWNGPGIERERIGPDRLFH